MAVRRNPLQDRLGQAIDVLIKDGSFEAPCDDRWIHTTSKETFLDSFRRSWEYLYLPLGAMFPVQSSSIPGGDENPTHDATGVPPGAFRALARFEAPLQIEISKSCAKFSLTKGYPTADFANLERPFVPAGEPWKLFLLSELLLELLWLAKEAVGSKEVRLAGFHLPQEISEQPSTCVLLDVLSIWAFEAKRARLCREDRIDFHGYLENTGIRWSASGHKSNEHGGRGFSCNADEDHDPANIRSVLRYKSFYDDVDSSGTLLFSHHDSAVSWNGKALSELEDSPFNREALCVLASEMKYRLFPEYDFSAYIIFGASPDLEGVYGQALATGRDGIPISASGTFIHVGLRCNKDEAFAISRQVHLGMRNLQAELFAYMAKVKIQQLDREQAQLKAQDNVFRTVLPNVGVINDAIARLQSQVQFVNLHISPAQEGLYSAYSKVQQLFEQGLQFDVPGRHRPLTIDHDCGYARTGRLADLTWVLSWAIRRFMGTDSETRGQDSSSYCQPNDSIDQQAALRHLECSLEKLFEAAMGGRPMAKSLVRLLHKQSRDSAEAIEELSAARHSHEHTLRESMLENLKVRYHRVLKVRAPGDLKLGELIPYLPIETTLGAQVRIWTNYGFASHAPLLRFLNHFLSSEDAKREGELSHFYHLAKAGTNRCVFSLMARSELVPNAQAKWAPLFNAPLRAENVRNDLRAANNSFDKGGDGNDLTGYGVGDRVTPFYKLLRAALKASVFAVDSNREDHLQLRFDERLVIEVTREHHGTYVDSISFTTCDPPAG